MIKDLSRETFISTLREFISPTAPIQSEQHLYGRHLQLQRIEQALCSVGRTIFIYGDRGVGKTSLAHTVAYTHQAPSGGDPIILTCVPHTTFAGLMADAVAALQLAKTKSVRTTTTKVDLKVFSYEDKKEEVISHMQGEAQPPWELNAIIAALARVTAGADGEQVIIADEFDRIASDVERGHFADLVKQIGDQRLPIKLILCGVADTLDKLLGAHGSGNRYLYEVKLEVVSWDARFEIIDAAAKALGVVVDDRPRFRIAAISDGFPHFIHRVCEHLFWQMFNDPAPCVTPSLDHYREAVAEAVLSNEHQLKEQYEQAVVKDASGYEDVLFAMADHGDMIRSTEQIYLSYKDLFGSEDAEGEVLLDRDTVVARINALASTSCGSILTRSKKGWYRFTENMMRGYVRLRAENQGLELALEYAAATGSSKELQWRVRGARRRRGGFTPQDWERLKNPPS